MSAETGFASDGKKKVRYRSNNRRNNRPFQTNRRGGYHNNFVMRYPELPIKRHADYIAEIIKDYTAIAVDAPTGYGKTLYLPYVLAMKDYRVRVAIPTTVAVRNAYRFQRDHSSLKVGFASGREIKYNMDDTLVYATTGHFTQKITTFLKLNRFKDIDRLLGDIVMIDELHTGTSQITMLIGLLRYMYTTPDNRYVGPRLLFTTATFNQVDILKFFSNFPIYRIEAPSLPVEVVYQTTPFNPLREDPNNRIREIIMAEYNGTERTHGIVFRPGLKEVEDTLRYLERHFKGHDIEFYPAYSSLTPAEMDLIFRETKNMKVVIGTNIIESSVTVPDVGFIIDDMLEKMAETSPSGGNRLSLSLISKAGSEQRKGRTGRTIPGKAYRLITESDYEKLSTYRTREVDRIPIYDIILQLLDANLDPLEVLKIDKERYLGAYTLLERLGMVKDDGVTEMGRYVSSIPLSVQNAYLVYLAQIGYDGYELRTLIAVACMIEAYGPSYLYTPRRERDETEMEYRARVDAHVEKYHEKFRGPTDIHTFVNLFWIMLTDIDVARKYDTRTKYPYVDYIKEWCVDNSMNNRKMREFYVIMRDVESIVLSKRSGGVDIRTKYPGSGKVQVVPRGYFGSEGFSLNTDLPEDGGYNTLGDMAASVFAKAYAGNRFSRVKGARGRVEFQDSDTGNRYVVNRNSGFNSVDLKTTSDIVVAQTVDIVGRSGATVHLASLFVTEGYI